MKQSITIAPPNSLILVMDQLHGEIPKSMDDQLIAATDTCIAIGTLSHIDGETTIELTDDHDFSDSSLSLAFNGILLTKSLEIAVCNVRDEKLMALTVSSEQSSVRVLVNDDSEPDRILIQVASN